MTDKTDKTNQTGKRSLAEILAAKQAAKRAAATSPSPAIQAIEEAVTQQKTAEAEIYTPAAETFSLNIVLNKEQELAKSLALQGKSFCLIGAAGTGKTTVQREIARALLSSPSLSTHLFRIQGTGERVEAPSIAIVAYTRVATGNIRKAIHKDSELAKILEHNVTTIHNLLEYAPVFFWDEEQQKETMRFVPGCTASNPLTTTHHVIEEASMVGLDLWQQLFSAMQAGAQVIFLGDINQLPPVFGPSILNHALTQLPVVELTHVYRQAGGSSILENAHRILAGETTLVEDSQTKIVRGGDTQYSQTKMALALSASLKKWYEAGNYDPEQDIVLSPFNVQPLGTESLNQYISQFLGEKREAVVWEILAGIHKLYLAVDDKVFYNKQEGRIVSIRKNGYYVGKAARLPSSSLTRFGVYNGSIDDSIEDAHYENLSIEALTAQLASEGELKRQASHIVEILLESGETVTLKNAGDFSPQVFSLGYALTVHKAQGCEWRHVILVLHKDHSIMAFRELLYTAVTRARENLTIIAKDFMLTKAIQNQRLKGSTLKEKIAYFNAGLLSFDNVRCIP